MCMVVWGLVSVLMLVLYSRCWYWVRIGRPDTGVGFRVLVFDIDIGVGFRVLVIDIDIGVGFMLGLVLILVFSWYWSWY